MGTTRVKSVIATAVLTLSAVCQAQSDTREWVELFNGTDLDDWTVKIRGYPAGENYANTFRIEDGLVTVRYDQYEGYYNDRFGHIFHKDRYSHYRILVEYRFIGAQVPGAPLAIEHYDGCEPSVAELSAYSAAASSRPTPPPQPLAVR